MKPTGLLLATTAMLTVLAPASAAQSIEDLKKQLEVLAAKIEKLEAKAEKAPVVKKAEPAMSIGTSDGMFEMNLRGRIYTDAAWVSDSDNTMDVAATEFRAARLGIEGKAWKTVKYKFEADFAGNAVSVKDAYMQYKSSFGDITVGQFKTPNSLEEQTSSRHAAFMERASFTDAFGLSRRIGIGYGKSGDTWTFKAGAFRGSNGDEGTGQFEFATRATYGGKLDGGTWMVGASLRTRDGDGSNFRYRQRPHQHLSNRFIATDRLSDKDTMYGFEGAASFGSFWASGEFASLNAKNGGAGGRNAGFWGGYLDAGWFITGEKRPLKLGKGAWDRPKVSRPLHEGGMGAWAIAARYDVIDLTADGVYGGQQDTWILGVNWYLNRHMRVMMNYNRSEIDKAFNVSANGEDGSNSIDGFGMRFQVDW